MDVSRIWLILGPSDGQIDDSIAVFVDGPCFLTLIGTGILIPRLEGSFSHRPDAIADLPQKTASKWMSEIANFGDASAIFAVHLGGIAICVGFPLDTAILDPNHGEWMVWLGGSADPPPPPPGVLVKMQFFAVWHRFDRKNTRFSDDAVFLHFGASLQHS